ncbi:TetR/AcrR family transcriptional regulator [Streptosporangium sp. NBC_01755]|uniref:TetR/AcrR family transcriptional regulator n=1 Tax=unclassified Streptosporangium TaxID=2632669 RepID=UPI002DDB6C91|nr:MULTISPECIES: TetR/AcrR family transcriptional regulator [unclassified Streptosporangium]WSA28297.1 TetR/AcrR family transcriptional regulator [Streptosporangium sp. NBC_01810]WSD00226.1 TetR/AcrR family transcriptional regulator [Streptosporangium sp. NBC_01755]
MELVEESAHVQDSLPPIGHWRDFPPLELPGILLGALEVFTARGYHGSSVRDLASKAGVTVPGLYYHYPSKQAVLVALLDTCISELVARARAAHQAAEDTPRARFAHVVESIVLTVAHRSSLTVLDSELRYLDPENRRYYAGMRKELENLLLEVVRAGQRDHSFAVSLPEDTTRALLGMFQAVATWYDPDGPLPPEQIARRYVTISLHTVGARPPA